MWDFIKNCIKGFFVLFIVSCLLIIFLFKIDGLNLFPEAREALVIIAAALVGSILYDYIFKQLFPLFGE